MSFHAPKHIITAAAIAVSLIASSAIAKDIDPPLGAPLPSAFEGLDWTIGQFPLGVSFAEAMQIAEPNRRLGTKRWVAKTTSALRDPIMPHTEYDGVNYGITNINAVSDRTSISPTHWHTGSMVKSVTRTVKSSKPELMPTPEDLVAATKAKFGPNPKTDARTYGLGGVGQRSFEILAYPVKNGELHSGKCFSFDAGFSGPHRSTQEKIEIAQAFVRDIREGGACEGVVVVMYSEGRSGRLREYRIVARDFLMDAENYLQDIETRIQMLEEYEANLPTVTPEL